jgi:hypothetical protein
MIEAAITFSNRFVVDDLPITGSSAAWETYWFPVWKPLSFWALKSYEQDISREPNRIVVMEEGQGTQENLVENEETQIQQIIFQIRTSMHIGCRARIADRLVALFNDAKEENPSDVGISLGSLRHFFYFMQSESHFICPSITLSPDNNIYVSWRANRDKLFSALFWPDGNVSFAIFKPNERHTGAQIRISGKATADILKETIAPQGVLDWISN